jgi:hypothetical protein
VANGCSYAGQVSTPRIWHGPRPDRTAPPRAESRPRSRLALDGGEFVTQLGYAQLELVVALVELGQALGGHVAPGFVTAAGPQHALTLRVRENSLPPFLRKGQHFRLAAFILSLEDRMDSFIDSCGLPGEVGIHLLSTRPGTLMRPLLLVK